MWEANISMRFLVWRWKYTLAPYVVDQDQGAVLVQCCYLLALCYCFTKVPLDLIFI